jgi:hypothetical protein
LAAAALAAAALGAAALGAATFRPAAALLLAPAGFFAGVFAAAGAGRALVPTAPRPAVRAFAVSDSGVGLARAFFAVSVKDCAAPGAFAFAGAEAPPRRVS